MKACLPLALRMIPILLLALSVILPLALTPKENSMAYAGPFDSPDEALSYFLDKRIPYGETRLPVERYLAANDQIAKMPVYSTATNSFATSASQSNLGPWTYLGPGNVGGRTRALLVDPNNSNTLLAGGVAGGIWKTTNGGASWAPKSDLLEYIAIGALARGPDGNLYAGTGESYALDGVAGLGIYLSTDGGESWPTTLQGTGSPAFSVTNRIAVSPSNPSMLYVATNGTLFRGKKKLNKPNKYSWTDITPGSQGGTIFDVVAVTVSGQTADTVVTALAGRIYKSTDNGNTWAMAYTSGDPYASRVTLAAAPSSSNVMYAMVEGNRPVSSSPSATHDLNAFLRSTDAGTTWTTKVSGPFNPNNLNTYLLTNPCNTAAHQGNYDSTIAVDPQNPNIV